KLQEMFAKRLVSSHRGYPPWSPLRQEAPRALPIRSVLIAEASRQILLLFTCAEQDQREHQHPGGKQEPVGRDEKNRRHEEGQRIVERVTYPAVGTARHERMLLPRDDRVGQIRS